MRGRTLGQLAAAILYRSSLSVVVVKRSTAAILLALSPTLMATRSLGRGCGWMARGETFTNTNGTYLLTDVPEGLRTFALGRASTIRIGQALPWPRCLPTTRRAMPTFCCAHELCRAPSKGSC
jgi:hypothetical protein